MNQFSDVPVLGQMSREQAIDKLRELDETDAVALLESEEGSVDAFGAPVLDFLLGRDPRARLYASTSHVFGYLAPASPGEATLPLHPAGNIEPDESLRSARVRITLDGLRVAAYPGRGIHQILFNFEARNQVPDGAENVHFNAIYRVAEGQSAPIVGYPIFVGLGVGNDGVALNCFTVNVKNDDDERLLKIFESEAFKSGLQLVAVAQPAIAPLTSMATGLTEAILKRNRNVAVQNFNLGLDFERNPLGARLATGSYVAIQVPETITSVWDWDDWMFNPGRGRIVSRADDSTLIPYNYAVFGISRHDGP